MTNQQIGPTPPAIDGIAWREARPEDVPALQQLQVVANRVDGPLDVQAVGHYADLFLDGRRGFTATLCGIAPSGDVVALGSVDIHSLAHEHRAYLDGLVHPDLRRRGLGTFLLEWGEARGRALLHTLSPDRPAVLLIDYMDSRDDAVPLYECHGFAFKLAENTMRRDLHETIEDDSSPQPITLIPWGQTDPHVYYETYYDAFRHRPGFPGWSEDVWREAFTGSDAFRPDLSLLATVEGRPAGYILCEIDQERNGGLCRLEGWILQMGVRPAWRGRGVGEALVRAALRAFRVEGLDDAMLDVNINNPQAQRLYDRLGFQTVARRIVYTKSVPLDERQ